jgi:hypothetical protein
VMQPGALLRCGRRPRHTVVAMGIDVDRAAGQAFNSGKKTKLFDVYGAFGCDLPIRLREVLQQGVCRKVRCIPGTEVETLQLQHVAAKFGCQV